MTEAKKTVLFEKHTALAGKGQIVPFAGWMMPVWYQSQSREHEAVRKRAGLFDCTHMAILEIAGKNAKDFLNILTTNDVSLLKPGKAQYSYILNFDGNIIDDVIVYCISNDNFMMVANAANEQKVKDWISSIAHTGTEINDLKNPSLPDARVDIALQGPASAECLKNIFGVDVSKLKSLTFIQAKTKDLDPAPIVQCQNKEKSNSTDANRNDFGLVVTQNNRCGVDVIISATGYTGAKVSFELFVHPDKASLLWDMILKEGKNLGVIPCGLGSRDSLRIEAGLPLYGHELAGEFNISPFQAGYGWAVKLQKGNFTPTPIPTDKTILESSEKDGSAQSSIKSQSKLVWGFIGKEAIAKKGVNFSTEVARLKFDGSKGVRPIRQLDGILSDDGICIGQVLSCAGAGDKQIVLALIQKEYNTAERQVGIYYLARNQGHIQQGRKEKVKPGDSLAADIIGKVVERFEKF